MSDGVKRYLVEYDHLLEKMPDRTCACTGVVLASDYLRVSGDCAALQGKLDVALEGVVDIAKQRDAALAEASLVQAELARVREALRPFAWRFKDGPLKGVTLITEDFEAAHAAYYGNAEGTAPGAKGGRL